MNNEASDRRQQLVTTAFEQHHASLLAWLRTMTDHHTAQDVMQELWIKVATRFPEEHILQPGILRRKARQELIDFCRRRKAFMLACERLAGEEPRTHGEPAYSADSECRLQERFWAGFPGIDLTGEQRQVVFLHIREGWTFKELEARTGIPASTACDWVASARHEISRRMNKPSPVHGFKPRKGLCKRTSSSDRRSSSRRLRPRSTRH